MIVKYVILVGAMMSLVAANVCFTGLTADATTFIRIACSLINEKSEVKITCTSGADSLFETPKLKLEFDEIKNVEINSCAFPAEGFNIVNFLSSLGINKLNKLKISNPNSPLKREHFSGLTLDALELVEMGFPTLPGDLLNDVKLNTRLAITSGSLIEVPKKLFDSVVDIQFLSISFNRLKKLSRGDFASFTNLTELLLSYNIIGEIEEGVFNGIENVQHVDLGFNKIKSLPGDFFHKLVNLQRIELSGNMFTELPANLLIENRELRFFRMNLIKFYYPGIIKSLPDGFFKGLQNLEHIELASIGLTSLSAEVFSGLSSLKKIALQENDIVELPAGIFDDATELEELNLGSNKLTNLPDHIFSKNNLRELNLSGNKLTKLTEGNLEGLYRLKILNIAANSLLYIYEDLYKYLNSLEEIDVSHNQLSLQLGEGIDNFSGEFFSIFHKCLHIRKLNAAHNKVTRIFGDLGFKRIKYIDLSNNEITEISISAIVDKYRDVYFNLASNKIALVNFNNLEDLKYCNIRNVVINIQNNPIQCGCNVQDLVRYLQEKMADNAYICVKIEARFLKCASPPEWTDRKVIDLDASELSCSAEITPPLVKSV